MPEFRQSTNFCNMEAVSAAASVAGLLSVAGHVLNGLVKLNAFIQDLKEADARAQRLTAEAHLLSQTLIDFKSLLNKLDEKALDGSRLLWVQQFATFSSRLEDCVRDLDTWTESYRPEDGPSSKRQKIIEGISNKRSREISEMESKLARHRSQIVLDMNTINGWMSLSGLERIIAIHEDVKKLTDTHNQMEQERLDRHQLFTEETSRREQDLRDMIFSTSRVSKEQFALEHHETRSQLSRLSDSVSSMAESLQQLVTPPLSQVPRRGSNNHSRRPSLFLNSEVIRKRRHSGLETVSSNLNLKPSFVGSPMGWTCAQAIGIDDYFIETLEDQHLGQMRCAFCDQIFANTESLDRSKHVVDSHNLAGCDQGVCYRFGRSFGSHLEKDHAANGEVFSNNIAHFKQIFFQSTSTVQDERIMSLYGEPQQLETSTAPLILETQLRHLISSFVGVERPTSHGLNTFHDMRQNLETLSNAAYSPGSSLELATTLYEAANLAEEMSVSFDRIFRSRWLPKPKFFFQKVPASQEKDGGQRPVYLGNWFLSFDSRERASVDSYKSCRECQSGARYSHLKSAFQHRGRCHRGKHCIVEFERACPDTSTEWFMLDPVSKPFRLLKKLGASTSGRDRVHLWMLNTLHKSEHLLVVLRNSAFFGESSIWSTKTDDATQVDRCSPSWGDIWSRDLLGAFDREEAALDDHVNSTQSDGAVYSRDYEVSSEGNDHNGVDVETRNLPLRFLDANSPVLSIEDETEL
ncbi:hypothetical protein BDP67DRAFT_525454 [Colletotrichum lupini]|nr:hypothetical protein BDP67DRAFT_525454 [Colletotrichum lupini]